MQKKEDDIRKAEEKKKERACYLNKIRGSLIGGAVGDALGYPVEFLSYKEIIRKYGTGGIRSYSLDSRTGLALVSDDTQMTLFTANGILYGETKDCLSGVRGSVSSYVAAAYDEWMLTQKGKKKNRSGFTWLLNVSELYHRRAPGTTCMSALLAGRYGSIERPLNHSKGCGGIMRVAPLGLHYGPLKSDQSKIELVREGAKIAAITHGHPLGYIPAAVMTHIVNIGVYSGCSRGDGLEEAVLEAMDIVLEIFEDDEYMQVLRKLIDKAIRLSGNDRADEENIRQLGEGWVAEETLAIAVYCSIRYKNDFSKAVVAAVNHSGDSDSTGAVTGNILGAWLGYEAIEEKWKQNLELKQVILEMADDLCYGCLMDEYSSYQDPVWKSKYVDVM